jgi:hypothetical protein
MKASEILLFLTILKTIEAKLVDNLLVLSHPSGPSHLSVAFALAEQFNDSEVVHDIRFPMLDVIWNFKSRENFKLHNYDFSTRKADEMKRYLDEFTMSGPLDILTIFQMIGSGVETLIAPCKLEEKIFDFSGKRNLALIDVFSSACNTVVSRRHEARIAYFAPGVEYSTISALTGAPVPSYAQSFVNKDPRLNFSNRLTNLLGHGLFKLGFLVLPLAKWWYTGDDVAYKNLEPGIVAVNFNKFIGKG